MSEIMHFLVCVLRGIFGSFASDGIAVPFFGQTAGYQ